jgi:hypothetical protein
MKVLEATRKYNGGLRTSGVLKFNKEVRGTIPSCSSTFCSQFVLRLRGVLYIYFFVHKMLLRVLDTFSTYSIALPRVEYWYSTLITEYILLRVGVFFILRVLHTCFDDP